MAFSIDFKILKSSIVNTKEDVEIKKDSTEPYSFIDFVKNLDIDNVDNDFIVEIYNKYIIEWVKIKNNNDISFQSIRKQKYLDLLKSIQLDYITQDEQRILGNINYDDPLELEIAIPFFIEKIKDIIQYYSNKRRDVKNSKVKWSTKGSKQFLENIIAEYITDNYTQNENTFQLYKKTYQELSSFQNQYRLDYEGLYDLNDYRSSEVIVDKTTFLSSDGDYVLSSLSLTSFSDYNPSSGTLIDELKKDIYKKYISTNQTYYNNGNSTEINSTTPFYDPYNFNSPSISKISDTTNLLRDKDIGYYFTSKYIYTSNYYSPFGISLLETSDLNDVLPLIDVYNSEYYKDYYFWSKYTETEQGQSGKPIRNNRLKRFYGYQSRDIVLNDSIGGVQKYTDDIQIWTGDKNNDWANEDIFDKFTDNILNRKSKTKYFFPLNEGESVYKYCCDIYGNQYYLIKKQNLTTSDQQFIYPIKTFSGGFQVNFKLLGQRYDATSTLDAIEIKSNVALGFYINTDDNLIQNYSDYNILEKEYYTLSSNSFNTETIPISSMDEINKKSIYENYYSSGRLVIKDSNNKYVNQLSSFVDDIFDDDNLYSDLSNNLINIDIINDLAIFTTPNKIITSKINYDYIESNLTFDEISKNIKNYYNSPFQKTASYWYDTKDSSIIFGELSSNTTYSQPELYYIDIDNNLESYNIIDNNHNYFIGNLISLENISKPCIIKESNSIYLLSLLKDVCNNYYYQLFKYDILTKNTLKLVDEKLFHPSKLKFDNNVINDITANSNILSSYINTINNNLGINIVYWDIELSELQYDIFPIFNSINSSFYDNDKTVEINDTKPDFKYNLNDLVQSLTPDINVSDSEVFYSYNGPTIYQYSDILLNFREIKNFSTFISDKEPIYKIEYFLGGNIITKFILSQDEIERDNSLLSSQSDELSALAQELSSTLELSAVAETNDYEGVIALNKNDLIDETGAYNDAFEISPINMKYITYNNKDGDNFSILFYSASGKIYRFEFEFQSIKPAITDIYSKLELVDARIKINNLGQKDIVIYINTRNPDYIVTNSIINI